MKYQGKRKDYEFGQRVWRLRRERLYTQERLAEMTGLSPSFICAIESGRKGTSSDTLAKLSLALRVSTDCLVFGYEKDSTVIEQAIARLDKNEQEQLKKLFQIAINIIDTTSKEK